jgi:hypothetical protein
MSKRSYKSPKVRIGKPPLRMRPTPQTSRTSPRRIHRQGRINEALALRCAMAQILVQAQSGEMGVPSIEFIVPTGAPGGQRVSPADMASPPAPPFPWQRQLAPPSSDDEPWFRDPLTGAMRQGRTET